MRWCEDAFVQADPLRRSAPRLPPRGRILLLPLGGRWRRRRRRGRLRRRSPVVRRSPRLGSSPPISTSTPSSPTATSSASAARLGWAGRGAACDAAIGAVRTGLTHGMTTGLLAEREAFAAAVVDPHGGKAGIREFMDKKSPPLPIRRDGVFVDGEHLSRGGVLQATKQLLPVGAPFFPAVDALPAWQYAFGIARDEASWCPPLRSPSHPRARTHRPRRPPRTQRRARLHADQRGQLQRYLGVDRHPRVAVRRARERLSDDRLGRRRPRRGARLRGAGRGAAQGRRPRRGLFGDQRPALADGRARPDVRRLRDPGL